MSIKTTSFLQDNRGLHNHAALRYVCLVLALCLLLCTPALAQTTPGGMELDEVLSLFEARAQQAMEASAVPGMAIAVVWDDQVVYSKGFGVKELGDPDPVDPDTLFQIGSTSKAFTAATVAQMVDRGYFGWHDKVQHHLKDFYMFDSWVTDQFEVWDLMAQHSGLPAYSLMFPPSFGYDRQSVINSLAWVEPVSSFRGQYAYQNAFFLVAAKLVEKYSGQGWDDYLRDHLLAPLGMHRTFTKVESLFSDDNASWLHYEVNGQVRAVQKDWPMLRWTDTYCPAGGLHSSANQMAQWLRMLTGGGSFEGQDIISSSNLNFLFTPATVIKSQGGNLIAYCQAWIHEGRGDYRLIWHNGDTGMSHAFVGLVPETRVGVVILSNLGLATSLDAAGHYFMDLFHKGRTAVSAAHSKLAFTLDSPPLYLSVTPMAASAFSADDQFTGNYANEVYQARVVASGDSLHLYIGPWQVEFLLVPDGGWGSFSMIDASNGLYFASVSFASPKSGELVSPSLYFHFDDTDQGPLANQLYRQ